MSYFTPAHDDAAMQAALGAPSLSTRWERPVLRLRSGVRTAVTAADIRASRRPCRETYSRAISARVSPWLSAGFLNMGASPNAVTALMLPVGIAGALMVLLATSPPVRLAGVLMFVLLNVLDTVDGEMARHSGRTSRVGVLLDKVVHVATDFALFSAVGAALFWQTGQSWVLVAAWALVLASTLDLTTVEASRRLSDGSPEEPQSGGWFQRVAGNIAFYHLYGPCVLADMALIATFGIVTPIVQSTYFGFVAAAHVAKAVVRFSGRVRHLAGERAYE